MKKTCAILLCIVLIYSGLASCGAKPLPKIGVAFGVGPASRWSQEISYMKEYAQACNIQLEARLNTDETAKPLAEDCFELIDSGIDVLIVRPRDVTNMKEIVDYAHKHDVKIISYDSLIEKEPIDLFIGYDSENIGEVLGSYLTEMVPKGDYILIWGDNNRNVEEMYQGAMKYIEPLGSQIHILLETGIPGWSSEDAKQAVKKAVAANGNKVDAIMAFNDKFAGACAEALAELNVSTPVVIAGMDAELDAVKRIITGTQSCTAYMDLKALSIAAVDQAVNLANDLKIETNTEVDNGSGAPVKSYLLTRQLVTRQNLDRILIESGYYTNEDVYDTPEQP